ncbi:MAG TPA: glycosyltransferase [Acidimicrobiales bacterium]|nr:glycosyltransferase [Acidimicrobiales bacterium]
MEDPSVVTSEATNGTPQAITAVVCTLGTSPTLEATCTSIAEELGEDDELLVIVDGGLVPERLTGLEHPIRVVQQQASGVAVARQRALEDASADVICYVDDDELVCQGWRDALAKAFADPTVGLAGGTILVAWPDGARPRWVHDELLTSFGMREAGASCPHLPFGGNFAVRRRAAVSVGGFRVDLGPRPGRPGSHEETELCSRLMKAGWRLAEVPGAVVEHHVRVEQMRPRWLLRRAWYQGRSDATMATALDERDDLVRLGKLAGLCVVLPFVAFSSRLRTYVAARLLVNLGYLSSLTVPVMFGPTRPNV